MLESDLLLLNLIELIKITMIEPLKITHVLMMYDNLKVQKLS